MNSEILIEAAIWSAMAFLAWNFQGIVARFPGFFMGMQGSGIVVPTLYARLLLCALASWEILINAGGNFLPPMLFLGVAGYLLYTGWHAEAEEHLHWLGTFACTVALVLCWQSLGGGPGLN